MSGPFVLGRPRRHFRLVKVTHQAQSQARRPSRLACGWRDRKCAEPATAKPWSEGISSGSRPLDWPRAALAGATKAARAADGAPTTLSPDEALAALKEGNARYVSHPELCSIDLAEQRASVAGASGALGDGDRLRRQPRPAGTHLRRPRSRAVVRRPQRRQPHRHGDARARSNTARRCSVRRSSSCLPIRAAAP